MPLPPPAQSAFLLLFLAAACSMPGHEARATQEWEIPATGIDRLAATSHNGTLAVTGVAGCTTIRLTAELSVRGHTEAEAQANLAMLEVVREVSGGQLRVVGRTDESLGWNMSPGFAFTLQVPPALAAELTTHNGSIEVRNLSGALTLETHNGSIAATCSAPTIHATTHNGEVTLDLQGEGPLDGTVESHNGGVEVAVGSGRSAAIEAATHNGSVRASRLLDGLVVGDDTLRGTAGKGGGRLVVTTHNGHVVIQ